MKNYDMFGKVIGRLTILKEDAGRSSGGDVLSYCECSCGIRKNVVRSRILNGHTQSCGCMRREINTARIVSEQKKQWDGYKPGDSSFNRAYRNYIKNAEKRGYVFKLTKEQFRNITQRDCHYCGVKPSNVMKSSGDIGEYIYNGIDRLDNTKGYVVGNFTACCDRCNKAKHTMSYKEYVAFITRSYIHLNSN